MLAGGIQIGARAEANVIDSVAAGELRQVSVEGDDLTRISDLLHRYTNLHGGQGLSVADASIVAVAERLDVRQIATLDITDFSIVRPRHVEHFTLLP